MKKLVVLLGVVGVSFSAVFTRWSTAPALVLALYRMTLSAGLMAVPALRRRELPGLTGRDVALCLVSGLFLGLHFTAYFAALERTSIAAAVVLVDTEVLFVALASAAVLGQRLPGKAWAAVGLAFGGAALVALADGGGGGALAGNLIALSGAAAMAVYTMIGAVCRRKLSTEVYTFLVYLAASASLLTAALATGTAVTGHGAVNLLTALGMAVCCTLLGHNVFSWGLKYLPAAFISTAKLLEPVLAAVWGLLIFGERPGGATLLGGAAVVGGIALYIRASASPEAERNQQ